MDITGKRYPLEKVTKKELWEFGKLTTESDHYGTTVIEFLSDGKEDDILMCRFDALTVQDKMLIVRVCGGMASPSLDDEPDEATRRRFHTLVCFIRDLAWDMTNLFNKLSFGSETERHLPLQFLGDTLSMTPFGLHITPFHQSAYFVPLKGFLWFFLDIYKTESPIYIQECLDMLEHFDSFEEFNQKLMQRLKSLTILMYRGWNKYEKGIVVERLKQLDKL